MDLLIWLERELLGLGEKIQNPDFRIIKGILRLLSRIQKMDYESKECALQMDSTDQSYDYVHNLVYQKVLWFLIQTESLFHN